MLPNHDPSQVAPSLHGRGEAVAFTEKESPVISNVESPLLKEYISMKVANISTHAVIDSRADISCARPEVLPKYHLQSRCRMYPTDVLYCILTWLQARRCKKYYRHHTCEGRGGQHKVNTKFYLVPGLHTDFTLGIEWLQANEACIFRFGWGALYF